MTAGGLPVPVRTLAALLALALLAAGAAACAASPKAGDERKDEDTSLAGAGGLGAPTVSHADLVPSGVIVIPRQGAAPEDPSKRSRRGVDEEDEAFFREKLQQAQAAVEAGDDETALQIVHGALELSPPERWDSMLRALRQTIKARHVELDLVRADARGRRDYVVFDEDVDFVVRLRNLGSRDLVISAPAGPGPAEVSGSVLALSVQRKDRDVYAASLGRSWTQVVPLVVAGQPDLVVPPEGFHDVAVRVPASEAGGAVAGLRILEVGGDLRLTGASVGIAEPIGRVPIRPGRVVVLPRNYEPIAAEPLRSLRRALGVQAPVHVLVAIELLDPADRAAAVTALADALAAGDADMAPTIHSALAHLRERVGDPAAAALAEPLVRRFSTHPARTAELAEGLVALTGVSLAADARLWEDWWRRGRAR